MNIRIQNVKVTKIPDFQVFGRSSQHSDVERYCRSYSCMFLLACLILHVCDNAKTDDNALGGERGTGMLLNELDESHLSPQQCLQPPMRVNYAFVENNHSHLPLVTVHNF